MILPNLNLQPNFLTQDKQEAVVNLLVGYVFPKGDCIKQIQWLAYRTWNAIKSIFGMSDWQRAISIIHVARMEVRTRQAPLGRENPTAESILRGIFSQLNQPPVAQLPRLDPIVPIVPQVVPQVVARADQAPVVVEPQVVAQADQAPVGQQDSIQRIIASVPQFNGYQIGRGAPIAPYPAIPLSGMTIRPANLFFEALGAEVTLPGQCLFAFMNPDKVRADIMNADPNGVVAFSARDAVGAYRLTDSARPIQIPLSEIYGENTYRISYQELQDTLNSQKIFCSPRIPKAFYKALKRALVQDHYIVLPGTDRAPVLLKDVDSFHCKILIRHVRENPEIYGFRHPRELIRLFNLSLYQIAPLIVKIENFHLFANGNGQIFERNAGEEDAIRLINACGIRGIRSHNPADRRLHETIMQDAFTTTLQAAENGFILFPAVGMGVWKGDPFIYWRALFEAIAKAGTGLEKIFINPRHAPSIDGLYQNRSGEECAEILNGFIYFYQNQGDTAAVANLQKVINLYDEKTDLLQLAYALKRSNPSKVISLVNASDPDVTLGNHTTQYSNNCPHGASTTEEHYSMLGTNGLCFERITGVHEDDNRIIQLHRAAEIAIV